jgi:hypothetical protein
MLFLCSPSMSIWELSCLIITTIALHDKTGLNILAFVTDGCAASLCRVLAKNDAATAIFGLKVLKKAG